MHVISIFQIHISVYTRFPEEQKKFTDVMCPKHKDPNILKIIYRVSHLQD